MDTQTTAKHIWNNPEQMHKVIEDERKADSDYFDEPPIKKVVIEEGPDGRQRVRYEMPPSQWAIDVFINESRNNQAKRGTF